jgi:RNA 2',3'-cyclic 3'-phosphodiesterase
MRLFIAIDPPPDITDKLRALQEKLIATKADVRWVASDNFHITIKFLGETDDLLLPEILARLTASAAQVPAFPLELEGLSRFPDKGPARVIVSRVLSPDQRLTKLHRLVDSALGGIGLPMDTRALVPHLTLGRVNSNHGLNRLLRLLEKHDLDFFGTFPVQRVILYQSLLGAGDRGTPRYIPVGSAPCAETTPTLNERPTTNN